MLSINSSYTTSYIAVNSNFCSRTHHLATIHTSHSTDDKRNTGCVILSLRDSLSLCRDNLCARFLSTGNFSTGKWENSPSDFFHRIILRERAIKLFGVMGIDNGDHRLRGSASPVLTETHHSYGRPKLSDFFPAHDWRSDPLTDFDAKWLKRRAFTQGCAFGSKNSNFSYPLISRAPKGSKFRKFLDLENFRSIWPLTLEVQRENTPYSLSEPNESGIVNRQSPIQSNMSVHHYECVALCFVNILQRARS